MFWVFCFVFFFLWDFALFRFFFGRCSWFSWRCSWFSWGVPGFGGCSGFWGCSGVFREVLVFRCSVLRCLIHAPKVQNLAKCCRVSLQSWMNQWNCYQVNVRKQFLKKSSILALKCGRGFMFPEKLLYSSSKADWSCTGGANSKNICFGRTAKFIRESEDIAGNPGASRNYSGNYK